MYFIMLVVNYYEWTPIFIYTPFYNKWIIMKIEITLFCFLRSPKDHTQQVQKDQKQKQFVNPMEIEKPIQV